MADWYYRADDGDHGPVDAATMKQLAQDGQITSDTLVRRGDLHDWVPASSVQGLIPATGPIQNPAAPRERPPASSSDPFAGPRVDQGPSQEVARAEGTAMANAFRPFAAYPGRLKVLGLILLIFGILQSVMLFGIMIGWLLIWGGLAMMRAANGFREGYPDHPGAVKRASENLSTSALVLCIYFGISTGFLAIYAFILLIFLIIGISQGFN